MAWDYSSEPPRKYVLTSVRTCAKETPHATFRFLGLNLPLVQMHPASWRGRTQSTLCGRSVLRERYLSRSRIHRLHSSLGSRQTGNEGLELPFTTSEVYIILNTVESERVTCFSSFLLSILQWVLKGNTPKAKVGQGYCSFKGWFTAWTGWESRSQGSESRALIRNSSNRPSSSPQPVLISNQGKESSGTGAAETSDWHNHRVQAENSPRQTGLPVQIQVLSSVLNMQHNFGLFHFSSSLHFKIRIVILASTLRLLTELSVNNLHSRSVGRTR